MNYVLQESVKNVGKILDYKKGKLLIDYGLFNYNIIINH